jgi:DNA-binding transcriptional activator of the SARP family
MAESALPAFPGRSPAREARLRAEFLALLVEQARLLEARADFDGAAAALRRVVAVDPVDDDAAAELMRVYALAGRRHEALLEYDRLRRTLDRELGAEPVPATQRLYEQIRAGSILEPDLSLVFNLALLCRACLCSSFGVSARQRAATA